MLSAIVGTTTYSLDDGTISRLVGFDGWGMAPSHRFAVRGPLQHGDSDKGYLFDPRVANIVLLVPAGNFSEMYTKRSQLLDIFNPSRTVKLLWDLPNGQQRQIDCKYIGDMSLAWDVKSWSNQKYAITLKASDPAFYNPEQEFFTVVNGVGTGGWVIPWTIDWPVGASTLSDYSISYQYIGTFPSYPIIRITGPIVDPILTNVSTGEKFDFTGTTIGSGDWIEIDCRYGHKTVVDQDAVNSIALLSDDSDLATFHIADSSEVAGGINVFSLSGTGGSAVTNVYMQFYIRYNGI